MPGRTLDPFPHPVLRGRNRLLDALPRAVFGRLEGHLESVSLSRGQVLHKPGEKIEHLYFPLTAMVSITVTMRDGKTVEAGAVGSREVVGINAFMGGSETTQTEYIVQVPGEALRIESRRLLEAFDTDKSVRDVLLKYTQAMLAHLSQNVACNRLHDIEQRYARWLLEVRDRLRRDDIALTQTFASEMLGVRRSSVTEVANNLREQGVISLVRGTASIRDVSALQCVSCECYRVLQEEYDRLLGPGD